MLASAAVVLSLAPAAQATPANHDGRLKICAYNVDGGTKIEVDGDRFARFPRDGTCESDKVDPGRYKINARGGASLSSGEVIDESGSRSVFYDLPETVRVTHGEQTRVNLYFF